MDKRTFISLFLVILLFWLVTNFLNKPKPAPQPAQKAQQEQQIPAAQDTTDLLASTDSPFDSLFTTASESKAITLSNKLVKAEFNSRGAAVTGLTMLDPRFVWADSKKAVNLIPEDSGIAQIRLQGSKSLPDLDLMNWNFEQPSPDTLVFWLGNKDNPAARKTFVLDDKYGIRMDVQIQNLDAINGLEYDFSAGIADSEKIKESTKAQDYRMILWAGQKLQNVRLTKLKSGVDGSFQNFAWAGLRTKYFTIAVCDTVKGSRISGFKASLSKQGNPAIVLTSAAGKDKILSQSLLIYAGPADYDIMKDYSADPAFRLDLIPERGAGWYRWLSNMIAWLLKFLHSFIPNYGVVIIIFSILLKIILHPLTHKSMDASLKMQRIQPQVQEIQKKYKNDPKTMQAELSKLYKEAGASPFSGCLPLLLQMPIFFALYAVLRYTLDMRNAYFMLWLKDLSEPDPYKILPIIMAGMMIVQSRMTRPSKEAIEQMDEKQKAMQQSTQMMTWLMPGMLFAIFGGIPGISPGLPSGLVLYYTVFNILGVAQQYYLQKHLKNKETK